MARYLHVVLFTVLLSSSGISAAPTVHEVTPVVATVEKQVSQMMEAQAKFRQGEVRCLARAMYFEARGESVAGQIAVAQVTLNRVKAEKFPDTVCNVVHEKRHGSCQYTWYCNIDHMKVHDRKAYDRIHILAALLYDNYYQKELIPDIVDGALFFQKGKYNRVGGDKSIITAHIDHQYYYRLASSDG